MDKVEAGRAPGSDREECLLVDPLRSSDARSRWPRVRGHFGNWRFIYVLIVLVIYSNIVFRAQFRGNFHDRVLNEGPVPDDTEPWTEWQDVRSPYVDNTRGLSRDIN